MRALALVLALLVTSALPVAAAGPTGVNGFIVNVDTHQPIAGAEVTIYRLPVEPLSGAVSTVRTDKRGFFANITLTPGRYIVMASALDARAGCEISDLYDGVVARVRIEISHKGEHCAGKNIRTALVVPGQTANVYIIH